MTGRISSIISSYIPNSLKVNVGAGTITANFDGKRKNKTVVHDRVLLGCDTILVAPVTVGKGAKTGAGAVVCAGRPVPAGKTVVGIPAQILQKSKKRVNHGKP